MLTKNGVHTLIDVVIVDPTQADLFPRSCVTQGFVVFDVIQTKERNYCNQHPTNQFLPLVVEIFECLHKQTNMFLHSCANAIWNLKRLKNLPLFILVTFLRQKISITLQRLQTSSILNQVVVVSY